MVSICDISRQSICRELVVMFELEDHELPIVRILFRMSDHSMEKKGQEELFYKFAMDKTGNADQVREIENDANTKSKYIYDSKCRYSIVVYKATCKDCNSFCIGNTQ